MKHELSDAPRARGVAVARDEDVELISADASHGVVGAEALTHALPNGVEQPVDSDGPEARLHAREAVEVEGEERVGGTIFGSGAVERVL
jgi:hypothetical protein